MRDHQTHTHETYIVNDNDPEYRQLEEFGVYKSVGHGALEVGRQTRRILNRMDEAIYADRMFFDIYRTTEFRDISLYSGGRKILRGGQLRQFELNAQHAIHGRRLELALIGEEVPGYTLKWFHTETLGDLNSIAMSMPWGDGYLIDYLMMSWSFWIEPLMPEGEDSDEGYSWSSPVLLNDRQWEVLEQHTFAAKLIENAVEGYQAPN